MKDRRLPGAAGAIVIIIAACAPGGHGATSTLPVATTATSTIVVTPPPPPSTPTTAATTTSTTTTTVPTPAPLSEIDLDYEVVAAGFEQPIFVTARPGDSGLYVADQPGVVWRIEGEDRVAILDITDLAAFRGEQGLLGLAFHPTDPWRMFVHYTGNGGETVVAEYLLMLGETRASFQQVILTVPQPAANHNGGMIGFGPDGLLYVALGDGGSGDDRFGNGQNPFSLLGALLRLDVGAEVDGAYGIPAGNPFADGAEGASEVWAWGLRNPWRFSFDGDDIWIGDVGQDAVEEIDLITTSDGGANMGWPVFEGSVCYLAGQARCSEPGFTGPLYAYRHTGGRCSVTGGYVYRGSDLPDLAGTYVFADFCTGEIFGLRLGEGQPEITVFSERWPFVTSFGTDSDGELYLTAGGAIVKIVGT